MDLYQAGYYRLGSQGSKSGWQLVSPSMGLSQKAKDGFKGIAANIIELKATGVPTYVSGIFTYDNFVYLLHTNYRAQGTDSRGVSYAHCYCFGYKEYYELAKEPEKLFGLLDGAFPNEYSGVKAYPVVNEIPYAPMDAQAILDKYGINTDNYRKLLLGAISASEGLTPPLCIKKELPLDEYEAFYKDMMFIIFKGLPEYLRIKVTSFSFRGNKNIPVYVSDKVETSNYVDLDAGEFNTDFSRLSNYRFTKVYNMNVAPHMLGDVWKALSLQTEATLENPLRDNSCLHFEEMFQAWQKKSQAGNYEIEPELAVDLLTAFSSFPLLESVETYDYFTALVESINNHNLSVTDKRIIKGLHDRYEKSQVAHAQYKTAVEILTLRMIFNGSDEATAFNGLFELKKYYPALYANLNIRLSKQDIELAFRFYLDKELGSQLVTYKNIENYIRSLDRNDTTPVADPFMRKFNRTVEMFKYVVSRSCASATDNNVFKDAASGAISLNKVILDCNVLESQAATDMIKHVLNAIWGSFNTNWFNPADTEFYRRNLHIEEIKPKHFDDKICANVAKVKTLMNLSVAPFSVEYLNDAMAVVYTNNYGLTDSKKTEMMEFMYNRMFVQREIPSMKTPGAFDLLLTITYDSSNEAYLADKLGIRMKACKTDDMFDSDFVENAVYNSALLKDEGYKSVLLTNITNFVDAVSRDKTMTYPKDALKGLKKYKRVLEGGDASPDSKNNFVTSLYRSFLGITVFTALAFFSNALLNYFSLDGTLRIAIFSVAVALFVLCPIISWGFANSWFADMEVSMEGYGLNEVPKLIIYLLLAIILIVAIVVLFILKMPVMLVAIVALAYVAVALILMILRDYMVENS